MFVQSHFQRARHHHHHQQSGSAGATTSSQPPIANSAATTGHHRPIRAGPSSSSTTSVRKQVAAVTAGPHAAKRAGVSVAAVVEGLQPHNSCNNNNNNHQHQQQTTGERHTKQHAKLHNSTTSAAAESRPSKSEAKPEGRSSRCVSTSRKAASERRVSPKSHRAQVDGVARQARQMGFKSVNHQHEATSALVSSNTQHRKHSLATSETTNQESGRDSAPSSTTVVRLRSASLSGLGDQARARTFTIEPEADIRRDTAGDHNRSPARATPARHLKSDLKSGGCEFEHHIYNKQVATLLRDHFESFGLSSGSSGSFKRASRASIQINRCRALSARRGSLKRPHHSLHHTWSLHCEPIGDQRNTSLVPLNAREFTEATATTTTSGKSNWTKLHHAAGTICISASVSLVRLLGVVGLFLNDFLAANCDTARHLLSACASLDCKPESALTGNVSMELRYPTTTTNDLGLDYQRRRRQPELGQPLAEPNRRPLGNSDLNAYQYLAENRHHFNLRTTQSVDHQHQHQNQHHQLVPHPHHYHHHHHPHHHHPHQNQHRHQFEPAHTTRPLQHVHQHDHRNFQVVANHQSDLQLEEVGYVTGSGVVRGRSAPHQGSNMEYAHAAQRPVCNLQAQSRACMAHFEDDMAQFNAAATAAPPTQGRAQEVPGVGHGTASSSGHASQEFRQTERAMPSHGLMARDNYATWMWRMRHTVDGSPMSFENQDWAQRAQVDHHPLAAGGGAQYRDKTLLSGQASSGSLTSCGGGGGGGTSVSNPILNENHLQRTNPVWYSGEPVDKIDGYQDLSWQKGHGAHETLAPVPAPSVRQHDRRCPVERRHASHGGMSGSGRNERARMIAREACCDRCTTDYTTHSLPVDVAASGSRQRSGNHHRMLSSDGVAQPAEQRRGRRLSSIVGSDGELCRRGPAFPTLLLSTSSSSLSSDTNLIRSSKPLAIRPHSDKQPPRSVQESSLQTMPNRRRLNRQPSSNTSDAGHHNHTVYAMTGRAAPGPAQYSNTNQLQQQQVNNQRRAATTTVDHHSPARPSTGTTTLTTATGHLRSNNNRLNQAQLTASGEPCVGEDHLRNGSTAANKTAAQQKASQEREAPAENGTAVSNGGKPKRNALLGVSGKSKSLSQHSPVRVASQLGKVSLAGAKKRLGFKQNRGLNSLSVHRSEEIFPSEASELLARQYTSTTTTTTTTTTGSVSLNDSCDLELSSRWLGQFSSESPDPRVCFVEGLGVGQIASRQALVSPYLGDIQVSLSDRRGMLEVEIIRVRQLQPKPYAKRVPSVYVKVYLMRNKKCLAKFKTTPTSHTLDPLYQQSFIFRDNYSGCVLQIIVWGDYGKGDRKSLMGIVQIHLNDLDMSEVVIGWYKLFNAPSMVANSSVASSSKSLRQTLSTTKLVDLTASSASVSQQQQQQQQQQLTQEPQSLR